MAQILRVPERSRDSLTGSEFAEHIKSLPPADREEQIFDQISTGNIPQFMRQLCPINVTNVVNGKTNYGTFFVTADYLSVGSDEDYFLTPLTPATAQRIADRLDCVLPTRKMVDAIYAAAAVKLAPSPIPPSPEMTTVPVFAMHDDIVRTQRWALLEKYPLGAPVAGRRRMWSFRHGFR